MASFLVFCFLIAFCANVESFVVNHPTIPLRHRYANFRSCTGSYGRPTCTILQLKACAQEDWENFILGLQSKICSEAEIADGKGKFCSDRWERAGDGGYGLTRVLEGGNLWEKAACSVSVVRGNLSKERAAAISARGQAVAAANQPYFAAACSLVFHSASPMVPTFRADVRYFKVGSGDGWYGGGADLTPYYLFEEVSNALLSFRGGKQCSDIPNKLRGYRMLASSTSSSRKYATVMIPAPTTASRNG